MYFMELNLAANRLHKYAPIVRRMAAAGLIATSGCFEINDHFMQPRVAEIMGEKPSLHSAPATIATEYIGENRLKATILENGWEGYSSFCWLFFSTGEEGKFLLSPKTSSEGEPQRIGKVVRAPDGSGSVVKIDGAAHPTNKILFRLSRTSLNPIVEGIFKENAPSVCRMTEEPWVSAFYPAKPDVVVVRFEGKQ